MAAVAGGLSIGKIKKDRAKKVDFLRVMAHLCSNIYSNSKIKNLIKSLITRYTGYNSVDPPTKLRSHKDHSRPTKTQKIRGLVFLYLIPI